MALKIPNRKRWIMAGVVFAGVVGGAFWLKGAGLIPGGMSSGGSGSTSASGSGTASATGLGDPTASDSRAIASSAEDFRLLDHRGISHQLFRLVDSQAVVIVSQQNGDPDFAAAVASLKALKADWGKRGVEFLFINATGTDAREAIGEELRKAGSELPVLLDTAQIISESLGLRRTPEAVVLRPSEKWRIAYRGPVSGLGQALQGTAGGPGGVTSGPGSALGSAPGSAGAQEGKLIPYARRSSLTFVEHAAPILAARCLNCHRKGMYPPENLGSYEDIREWSAMIRETVRKGIMPPWKADSHYGAFRNDTSMTPEETRTLIRWIESGMERGAGADPLLSFEPAGKRRPIPEEPDFVLSMDREIKIPPEGFLKYQYIPIGKPFPEDVWVSALQLESKAHPLIHHASMVTVPPDKVKEMTASKRGYKKAGVMAFMGRDVVKNLLWAPGKKEAFQFAPGTAMKIEKGSQVVLEMHYVGNGREMSDTVDVKFFAYNRKKPPKQLRTLLMRNLKLNVPPNDPDYVARTPDYVLDRDIAVTSFMPHMHMRGQAIKTIAYYPDGTSETLVSIPAYDFNWQKGFALREPKRLPKGTKLVTEARYDNSRRNPNNPDPSKASGWGHRSVENEMLNMNLSYYEDNYEE